MKSDSNKITKKTILLIVGVILLVVILAITTAIVLKYASPSSTNQTSQDSDTSAQAKAEYDKAQDSLAKGELPAAKTSFEKAQALYKQTHDSAHLKEIDAALSLINHSDPQTVSTKEAPTASIPASNLQK